MIEGDDLYRSHLQIVAALEDGILARIPHAHLGQDGNLSILFNIFAGQVENLMFANQLVLDNTFIQTSSAEALILHGDQEGLPLIEGIPATGQLTFSGEGGAYIPAGTEVSTNPNTDILLYFTTTSAGTIPNPGSPAAPTAAINVAGGNLTGAYEYTVTFVTTGGETAIGLSSNLVNPSAQQVNLTNIPVGGTGTLHRNIFRQKNNGGYNLVTTILNNTATTYTDNIADGSIGQAAPLGSTAEKITIPSTAVEAGRDSNVGPGIINQLSVAPSGIYEVTNLVGFGSATNGFTPGIDREEIEDYRGRLLDYKRNPRSGSLRDLESWARQIAGVETATATGNDFLGTLTNGHVTIRIAGHKGSVPTQTLIDEVYSQLSERNYANIAIHVASFSNLPTDISINVALMPGYALPDVNSSVILALTNYIDALPVGGTLYVAGIYDAVFGTTGVQTLVVNSPQNDLTTPPNFKRVIGTVIVS